MVVAIVAVLGATTNAEAQFRRGRVIVAPRIVVGGSFFYDPWFDPFYGAYEFQYPIGPYGYPPMYRGYRIDATASVRVEVKPKEAEVYVDGYYAGIVDDFDGVFQRLRLPPGEHEITLRLPGYRSVHQKLYLTRDATYKLRYTLEPLAPGESTEPPPVPPTPSVERAMVPPGMPPQGMPPRRLPPQAYPQQPPPQYPQQVPHGGGSEAGSSATLTIRVQPSGADVTIDGERWQGPEGDERLLVQVSEGPHRIEVQKSGYRRFSTEIQARRGETVPLNVALTPER